jgi:hypothetical protein
MTIVVGRTQMTPEESDFISRGSDLVKSHNKDFTCKSCQYWRPRNVKLVPAHCMNPFNDKLVTIFNPHGFDWDNLRQVLESKHSSSCKEYKFEKGKYNYLLPEIKNIKDRHGVEDVV